MDTLQRSEMHDFEMVGGALCLDFLNTQSSLKSDHPHDHFGTYADLLTWSEQSSALSPEQVSALWERASRQPREAEAALKRAQDLRSALYALFGAVAGKRPVPRAPLVHLNEALSDVLSHLRLEARDGGYMLAWDDEAAGDAPLDRMLWPVARSAADLLVSGRLDRVRQCAGETCGWYFADTSKNNSRRWCDMSDCGNRAKARRHYGRKRKSVGDRSE